MKEIKFRQWTFGSMKFFNKPEDFKWLFGGDSGPERTLTECELEQYIGREDKKDIEIYEGDCFVTDEYEIGFIEYNPATGSYCFRLHEGVSTTNYNPNSFNLEEIAYYNIDEMEIIGNIHDNEEENK